MTEAAKGADGTSVHLQVKFGRNGSMALNLFAPTVQALVNEATELGDSGPMLVAIAEQVQAFATVAAEFPGTEAVKSDSNAKMCAHKEPMEFKRGETNGKKWSGWFCKVRNDPALAQCKPEFDR